jgi:opacity protein-like surface antigen
MKKLITAIAGIVMAALLMTSTMAADTNSPSLFNKNEIGLTLGSTVNLDAAANYHAVDSYNLNLGAFWFPTRNLGFEASVPLYYSTGQSIQEVNAGLLWRLPLAKDTVILKNLAPYVGLGGVYNWQTAQNWAYVGKVGVEARLNKKWGLFVEGQYRNSDFVWANGQVSVGTGLRLIF